MTPEMAEDLAELKKQLPTLTGLLYSRGLIPAPGSKDYGHARVQISASENEK
jgi:hypothetical protein